MKRCVNRGGHRGLRGAPRRFIRYACQRPSHQDRPLHQPLLAEYAQIARNLLAAAGRLLRSCKQRRRLHRLGLDRVLRGRGDLRARRRPARQRELPAGAAGSAGGGADGVAFSTVSTGCSGAEGEGESARLTRSTRVSATGVSFIAVLVRSTPPPNPNPSAPTTVPTPRRYDDKEKGIVVSVFTKANARIAPPFRRCGLG